MDIHGFTANSLGESTPYSSDIGTKRTCILLVLDDITCHNIVSDMLHNQTYEGKTMDTLNAIWERKNIFNLVLTNIHRLNTNGVDILQIIKNKLNLPTILMSPDDTRYENQVQDCSVAAYVVNVSDTNEMNKLWQMALEKEKARKAAVNQEENYDNATRLSQNVTETSTENTSYADNDAAIRAHDVKGKRKAYSDRSEENGENRDIEKKRRVVWTPKMHQNFLQAIQQLGHESNTFALPLFPEKAVPKKIVEIMNETGLTREHVASHLQKYRMCLKRAQESSATSIYDQILTNDAKEKCFQVQPYLSSLNFNATQGYSCSAQQPFQTHFQQGTGGMNSRQPQMVSFPNMVSFQQQNDFLDFANSRQPEYHSGQIGQQSTFLPRVAHNSNFRVFSDKRKNMLFSIQSGKANQPTNSNSRLDFIGFRLSNDGKSVNFGQKGSSSAVISNNTAYSGLCSSMSEDYIHKQQPSPPFLEIPDENTLIQCSSAPPENFTIFNHPSNSISEQQRLLLFDNAANTISCQSQEMHVSFIPQEQLSAQQSSGDLEDYSAILFGDEVSVPPLENSVNYDSRQQEYSVPELPQEFNSLGNEIDIKSLLETTENRSSQLFWEEGF
ncbi:two-component response regulator ARR12-like [Nicotiana tomentosiformis]|uniref:two-component response regulator ARR12-like n=1 Tax=Nicotiana tomentosiformis TaxID=4098 RepID=UPI00051BDCFC|nr:two-component response regulator ARR12-like [Nicotiana tomentosiformis]